MNSKWLLLRPCQIDWRAFVWNIMQINIKAGMPNGSKSPMMITRKPIVFLFNDGSTKAKMINRRMSFLIASPTCPVVDYRTQCLNPLVDHEQHRPQFLPGLFHRASRALCLWKTRIMWQRRRARKGYSVFRPQVSDTIRNGSGRSKVCWRIGTNADVFIRIMDKNGKVSEDLPLRSSTDHRNQFERGQIDEFDVGTSQPLNGIDSIDLWTNDKGLGSGWFPEYLQLVENKTGDLACFSINQYLNEKNGGIETNPLHLTRAGDNQPCDDTNKAIKDDDSQTGSSDINVASPISDYKSTFSVIAKTGSSSTDAYAQLPPSFEQLHSSGWF